MKMTLNKRESRSSLLNTKNIESKGNNYANTSSHKMAYLALHDAYNDQHRNPNSSGHQYFNDIDDLDDYHDGVLPHEHADAIFDPPPIGRDTGGDVAPPWLGLHLEQQTVMMAQWTTERRAMAEENDRLRRLLAEAEERIRELELIAPLSETGKDKMASPGNVEGSGNSCGGGSSTNPAEVEGRIRSHKRSESGADCGSVCSVATTVIAGTNAKFPCHRGTQPHGTEKSIGARRTAERCKEGLGRYRGGEASKKMKRRFFSMSNRARNRGDDSVHRGGRSRSYSPRRREGTKKPSTHRKMVTRVVEEILEDIDTPPSSCAGDDETVGISDHTGSPPATPERSRAQSLSPLPFPSPPSRNISQKQPSSPSSISVSDPQGKKRRSGDTETKLHYRTTSLPPSNKTQVLKGADALNRPTNKLVEKRQTEMIYSTGPKRIILSKVTGIKSRSRSGASKDVGNNEREAAPGQADIEVVRAKSLSNKYSKSTILLYGRNDVDKDDDNPLIEI